MKATDAGTSAPATSTLTSAEAASAQRELQDGLTDEQRRMLDELGKS
jgi:hypothetical protein